MIGGAGITGGTEAELEGGIAGGTFAGFGFLPNMITSS
jgi:hypothetical protein